MHKYFILACLLLLSLQSHAQFLRADHKKAIAIEHRPLAVALFDLAEAENECDSIYMSWYNEKIVEILSSYWTLNDSIIYKKKSWIASVVASKSNDYAVFSARPSLEGQQSSNDVNWSRSYTFMLFLSEDGKRLNSEIVDRNSPLIPDSEMSGQLLRGRYIFKLSFKNPSLSENDLVFALQQFEEQVGIALFDKKPKGGIYAKKIPKSVSSDLKTITLLIPNNLDPEGIDDDVVSKYYDHPFRIARQEEIEAAITAKKENTAYLHYIWSDQERMFLGTVIDAQSGQLLAVLSPGSARLAKFDCLPPGVSYRTQLQMKVKKLKGLSRAIK
jgi:hypothetical protein